jgi:signal transduction histidine kinase/ligand-binding sensor domain-containing protein
MRDILAIARRACVAALALLAALALASTPAPAHERVVRVYDERDGLAVGEIAEIVQDTRGFLWIGTIGSLVRFDGAEMRQWAPESIRHVIQILTTSPDGEVVVAGLTEPLVRVAGDSIEPVIGPRGGPITNWVHAAFAHDGALWVATRDTLWRRDAVPFREDAHSSRGAAVSQGDALPFRSRGRSSRGDAISRIDARWSAWPLARFDSSGFYRVAAAGGDSVFVATRGALYACAPRGRPRAIAPIRYAYQMQRLPDGTPFVLTRDAHLWRLSASGPRLVYRGAHGALGLAVRGGTVWATVDQYLIAFAPHKPPEIVAPAPGLPSGRPLFVDREGTLWIGGFRGLLALPEPETVAWNDADGLPSPPHAHHLARTRDAVWVVTWFGSVRMDLTSMPRKIVPIGDHSGRLRLDGRGRVWGIDWKRGLVRYDGARATAFGYPGVHGLYGTSLRRDGTLWLATDDGLFLTPAGNGAPRVVTTPPPTGWPADWRDSWIGPILEDREGRLWVMNGDEIAWANADSVARNLPVAWRRESVPGSEGANDLLQLDDGEIWMASFNLGVLRRVYGRWEQIPGNRDLRSLRIYGMDPSPRGGVWVLAAGTLARVMPRPHDPNGWRIVERLTSWQGMPTQQAADIAEDPDGRLWLATLAGLVEVSPEARRAAPQPPHVEPVALFVDGKRLPMDRAIRLPWKRNRIEIRFAALTYRGRERLRYETRLRPNAPWVASEEPVFRFVDLAPGTYTAELRASLDGAHWSAPPTRVMFRVAQPWWSEPWALAIFAALAFAILYAAHRVRVAFLLRLERQRMRIARDLHDEMGSGLGSIGILAGLAAGESVDDAGRRQLAGQIAETASDLGGALADIVQSLKHGSDTLESLMMALVERGRRLLPGDSPTFVTHLPESWPLVRLAPEMRRELQLIVLEALHNAARHAAASRVELGIQHESDGWRLWVADDGRGLPETSGVRHGHGLTNMQTRAAMIGATIVWRSTPGHGTTVEIRFDPHRTSRNHGGNGATSAHRHAEKARR